MSLEFSLKKKMTPNPVGRVLPSSLNETAGRATEGGTVTRKPTALLNKYLSGVLARMERHPRNEWGGKDSFIRLFWKAKTIRLWSLICSLTNVFGKEGCSGSAFSCFFS